MPDKSNAKKIAAPKKSATAVPQTPVSLAQQSSTRNFVIITIVITALVVLGGGYAIYTLANMNIKRALEVRAQDYYITLAQKKKSKLEDAEPQVVELKKADGSAPSTFDYVTKRVLPATGDFQGILTIFNTLEQTTLVNVESITRAGGTGTTSSTAASVATPTTTSSGAQSTQITLKVNSSQEQITAFLRAIERSARVMDFQSMKLSGDKNSTSLGVTYTVYNLPKPSVDSQTIPISDYEANKGQYE